jgi:hypothetical protein
LLAVVKHNGAKLNAFILHRKVLHQYLGQNAARVSTYAAFLWRGACKAYRDRFEELAAALEDKRRETRPLNFIPYDGDKRVESVSRNGRSVEDRQVIDHAHCIETQTKQKQLQHNRQQAQEQPKGQLQLQKQRQQQQEWPVQHHLHQQHQEVVRQQQQEDLLTQLSNYMLPQCVEFYPQQSGNLQDNQYYRYVVVQPSMFCAGGYVQPPAIDTLYEEIQPDASLFGFPHSYPQNDNGFPEAMNVARLLPPLTSITMPDDNRLWRQWMPDPDLMILNIAPNDYSSSAA